MVPFLCGCGAEVAHLTFNQGVVGSNPTFRTKAGGRANRISRSPIDQGEKLIVRSDAKGCVLARMTAGKDRLYMGSWQRGRMQLA